MKKFYIIISAIIFLFLANLAYAEQYNNTNNTPSKFYIGISPIFNTDYIPLTLTNIVKDGNGTIKDVYWNGQGAYLDFLYVPSFSNQKKSFYYSFNTSIGIINWSEQQIEYDNGSTSETSVNKGISYILIPSLRLYSEGGIDCLSFGAFFHTGVGIVYYNVKNTESFENTSDSLKFGFNFGLGLSAQIQQVRFEFGPSWMIYFNSYNKSNLNNLLNVKLTLSYQVF